VISLARAALDRAESTGKPIATRTLDAIPPFQWEVYWNDLAPFCPSRLTPKPVKQRNALRVELLPDSGPRCSRRSPDGRGLTWFLSGGEPLAYGRCEAGRCPRASSPPPDRGSDRKERHDGE
jgi:hypothetical protein